MVAVALVMACGLAMLVMARSLIYSLESTRQEYYEAHRFAEVFAHLKRAPNALAARVAEVAGVATAQAGISVQVTLDLDGLDEPASGQATMNLLAFGLHTLLDLTDESYRLIRSTVGARRKFFQHLEALTTYLYFQTWERLMDFMLRGLEIGPYAVQKN